MLGALVCDLVTAVVDVVVVGLTLGFAGTLVLVPDGVGFGGAIFVLTTPVVVVLGVVGTPVVGVRTVDVVVALGTVVVVLGVAVVVVVLGVAVVVVGLVVVVVALGAAVVVLVLGTVVVVVLGVVVVVLGTEVVVVVLGVVVVVVGAAVVVVVLGAEEVVVVLGVEVVVVLGVVAVVVVFGLVVLVVVAAVVDGAGRDSIRLAIVVLVDGRNFLMLFLTTSSSSLTIPIGCIFAPEANLSLTNLRTASGKGSLTGSTP